MALGHTELWEKLVLEKTHKFQYENCDTFTKIPDFEVFRRSLIDLSMSYSRTKVPSLIQKLLTSIKHLQSFSAAITSSTQGSWAASLVWGGTQAVIVCACKHAEMLESIVDILVDLNNSLPMFDAYLALFPDNPSLQWPLRDLYAEYLEFCLRTIKYLNTNPLYSFTRWIWTSSPQQKLQQSQVKMQKYHKIFEQETELIHRETLRRQHIETIRMLSRSGLSEDKVDRPGVSFPVYSVPLLRNLQYSGREALLLQVHESLKAVESNNLSGPSCCVLNGCGGIGKTQTALEYTYRYRDTYDAIFWISAPNAIELASSYATIASKVGLSTLSSSTSTNGSRRSKDMDSMIEEARNWFDGTNRNWLLIFDNVNSWKDIATYMPNNMRTRGSILITTQIPDLSQCTAIFTNIAVAPLTVVEATSLLMQLLGRKEPLLENKAIAEKIVQALGGYPLSIATVGGYILQSNCSLGEYFERFNKSSVLWKGDSNTFTWQYEKTLQNVCDVALSELPATALELLEILAFLNPDETPEAMIVDVCKEQDFISLRLENLDHFQEMTRRLSRRQLVRRTFKNDKYYLSMHRSLQWVVLHRLAGDPARRNKVFLKAIAIVRRAVPRSSPIAIPDPRKWPIFELYLPQVLSLQGHAANPLPPLEQLELCKLLIDGGVYLWGRGFSSDSTQTMRDALQMLDNLGVAKLDFVRYNIHAAMGATLILEGTSKCREALFHKQRVYEIYLAYKDNPPTDTGLDLSLDVKQQIHSLSESGLGVAYLFCGQFENADEKFARTLSLIRESATEESAPLQFARCYINIALVRAFQGLYGESLELAGQAEALAIRAFGESSGGTVYYRFLIHWILNLAGRFSESLALNEKNLAISVELNGKRNVQTINAYIGIGIAHLRMGNATEAEPSLRIALDHCKHTTSVSAATIARTQFYLSQALSSLGKLLEAEALRTKAESLRLKLVSEFGDLLTVDCPDEGFVYDQIAFIPYPRNYSYSILQRERESITSERATADENVAAEDRGGVLGDRFAF
ncbi:hypothetical protein DL95DRAFT_523757 [Leptodontidium sp. 2 PMI_412]|nr:hypothetical protein DL95DRAFT_523757 [Leptodontidium sp. 2 PMI_412]